MAPSTARHFSTLAVAGLVGLATGAAIAWAHWLEPDLEVGVVPVAGIALAALLLLEPRRWPLPLIAMAGAVTAVGLLLGDTARAATAPAAAAVVAAVLAAVALRIWARGPFTLRRTVDVAVLTVVAAVSAVAGAVVAAAITGPAPYRAEFWEAVGRGALAIGLGMLVVPVVVLSWTTPLVAHDRARGPLQFRLREVSLVTLVLVLIADGLIMHGVGVSERVDAVTGTTVVTFQLVAIAAVLMLFLLAAALEERDIAEARRSAISDRFRRTFETAPVGIAITTLDGIVTDANPALCATLGYSRRELLGTHLESLRSGDDSSGELGPLPVPITGADQASERRYVSAHGELVAAEVSESLVRGPDGEPASAVVIFNDVTLRKDLEEQVLHSQKMDVVGRLAGGIAHDFNNLLAVMRGHSELLEDDLAVVEQARQRLVSMRRATDRAAALTNDLLTFSRRSNDEPEIIDVHQTVTSVSEMVMQLIGPGVTIELRLEAEATLIDADPRQIEQVLVNLVVNASDAMPSGGRITLATSNGNTDDDDAPAGVMRITVADTGTGITPQVQRRMFEPFFTTKPAGSGTGLGLSTAARVVQRCGGTISVDSQQGVGTTFAITLPLSASEHALVHPVASTGANNATMPALNGTRETILVVDDEPDVRETVAELLRGRGYHVLEAADAGAALDLASSARVPIDLVVSDVVMPGMGGPELADWLRIHWPDTEVLFVSGHSEIEATSACLRGARLLRKPVQRAVLIAEVETALDLHEARIRARSGIPRRAL